MAEDRSLLYLPEALEEDILVRLPVKSISRFESVCKRWYSLFRSKDFSEFYFGHHQVSLPTKKDLRLIYPKLTQRRRRHKGSGTTLAIGPLSNGIYALTSVLKQEYYNVNEVLLHTLKIGLLNPATRQMKFAPPFPDEYLPLITGISSHHCSVSCGMDDDYRTVVLINYEGGHRSPRTLIRHCFLVFLYTWRTGKWERLIDYNRRQKRIGLPLPPATNVFENTMIVLGDLMSCSQKLFHGCWHWMTLGCYDEFGVLSFDFEAKSFGLIPGPRCNASLYADVFVLQDHLAAIVIEGRTSRCEIWMKTRDPKTTWTNVYRINVVPDWSCLDIILHEVDYYPVQESELIRIKKVVLIGVEWPKRLTFDEKGDLLSEYIEPSIEISFSVGGISKFTPTLEPLP